jgi:hypothetical protein
MIDKQTAYNLAVEYLNKNSKCEIAILDDKTVETEYGWIFFYDSKKWVETKTLGCRMVGNIPVLVEKVDGSIRTIYEGLRYEATLEEYLEQKRQIANLPYYVDLEFFLSAYMKTPDCSGFPNIESAIEYYVRYNKPQEIQKVISQGRIKLDENPFEWKSIRECTERFFKSAEQARQWLEKVISMLESTQNVGQPNL